MYTSIINFEKLIHYNLLFVIGIFATVILQLPVNGGHEGGRLKVEYEEKEEFFDS